jgi:hypothetical protein
MAKEMRYGYPKNKFPNGYYSYFYNFKIREDDIIFSPIGKTLHVDFGRLIAPHTEVFDDFFMQKQSYIKALPEICEDLNFFEALYDRDHELLTAMYRIKYIIDSDAMPECRDVNNFRKLLYDTIATPSIIKKIDDMIEDNYSHDINEDARFNSVQKKRAILEFTNEQVKCILKSAHLIKPLGLLASHYAYMMKMKIGGNNTFYADTYMPALYAFSTEFDIYNKSLAYLESKVREDFSHHSTIYSAIEIDGVDAATTTKHLMKHCMLTDIFIKFRQHIHWTKENARPLENVLSFYKTVPKTNLGNIRRQQFKYNIIPESHVSQNDDSNSTSSLDRLKMALAKINEELVVLSDYAVKERCDALFKQYEWLLTDERVLYYRQHLALNKMHTFFIQIWFSAYIGGASICKLLTALQVIKLLIILEYEAFRDVNLRNITDLDDLDGLPCLPFIITGTVEEGGISKKTLAKDLNNIEENPLYKQVIAKRYQSCISAYPTIITDRILAILNNKYTIVCYDSPDITGLEAYKTKNKIVDEFLLFLLKAPDSTDIYPAEDLSY